MSIETVVAGELICSKKNLPTAMCVIAYGMRDCPDAFVRTLELAEGSGNVDLLAHLLSCESCRTHIAEREQRRRDNLVRDALKRITHGIENENVP